MIPISKIAKDLNIKPHQLREWEKRGWLGNDPILKDADNNGQRIYNEYQIERIHFIHQEILNQKKNGIVRTDIAEMDAKLLDKFGGEITQIESHEMTIHTASLENMAKLIIDLSKKVSDLQEELADVHKKTDKIIQKGEEEQKRIAERDERLMHVLNESLEAKRQIAATSKKNIFQRLFKKD